MIMTEADIKKEAKYSRANSLVTATYPSAITETKPRQIF